MILSEFNLIWIESCAYFRDNDILKHKHDFFHYIYVNEGSGNIKIGETWFKMSMGNIYMVPPYVDYTFLNSGEKPLKTFEIQFDTDDETMKLIERLPSCMDVRNYPVKSLLMSIYRETEKKEPFFSEVVSNNFRLILTYLLRCHQISQGKFADDGVEKHSLEIDKVLNYIYENLAEDISLDALADIAGFEKNYFLRKFKKITQCTPMNFIREKRIEKAKELLCYSDMNVSQIAAASGFKTVHYFSKVFFESTGIRPSDYRNGKNIIG